MRKGIFKTAVVFMLTAVFVVGFAISAFAVSGENAAVHLFYTYYDTRGKAAGGLGLTDNYFTATNTSTTEWVQAHVRVRTGERSIELLDFDILMSPTDVFTMDIYEDNGAVVFASCDTKTLIDSGFTPNFDRDGNGTDDCFVLDSTTFPNMISLIKTCNTALSDAEALAQTRKGYVEIIQEGSIRSNKYYNSSLSKNHCSGADGDPSTATDNVVIAGKMLDHTTSSQSLYDSCNSDVYEPIEALVGRQYFVEVSNGNLIERMAHLNSENLDDNNTALVLHLENYDAERISAECTGVDGAPCYAYVAPVAGDTVNNGADDLNYCTYRSTLVATNDVANKFGAGATFGPTLIDMQEDNPRDGTLAVASTKLGYIMGYSNDSYSNYNGGGQSNQGNKEFVMSHYFASPAPGIYDVNSGFAFTFPYQHYIAEKDSIAGSAIFDNEENTTSVPFSKFISPGLPTTQTFAPEASLFTLANPPFAEGWVKWAVSATNATGGCTETADPLSASCETYPNDGTSASISYTPAYTGAYFTFGANHIGASHYQYSNRTLINVNGN